MVDATDTWPTDTWARAPTLTLTQLPAPPTLPPAVALGGYLAIAVAVTSGLWAHLDRGRLATGGSAQALAEWLLWHAPHAIRNPLFTNLLDAPAGVNLMAHPGLLGLSLPLAPLTLAAGPAATFATALTLGLAGSAAAWYWLLRRWLRAGDLGSAVGAAFCAFAPALLAQAGGAQLGLIVTVLVPFIVWHVLRLAEPDRAWRSGIALALLIAGQVMLNQELAVLTGVGLFVAGLARVAVDRSAWRALERRATWAAMGRFAAGVGVALIGATVLLAYPLWWQFTGPQHGVALLDAGTGNDALSVLALPSPSFIGGPSAGGESDAQLGLPLVLLLVIGGVHLRHDRLARTAGVAALMAIAVSLISGSAGPVLPIARARLALMAVPLIGVLLAQFVNRALAAGTGTPPAAARRVRGYALLAIAAALVSIAPKPLTVIDRPAPPDFITSGAWQQVVTPGSTVLVAPMTADAGLDALDWQIRTGGAFALAGSPAAIDSSIHIGQSWRPATSVQRLADSAWLTGATAAITADQRTRARGDLITMRVDAIFVVPGPHVSAVITVLTALLDAPPVRVDDVWTWRIRAGTAIRGGL